SRFARGIFSLGRAGGRERHGPHAPGRRDGRARAGPAALARRCALVSSWSALRRRTRRGPRRDPGRAGRGRALARLDSGRARGTSSGPAGARRRAGGEVIRSMTGFGAGRAERGAEAISVELRSVNAKFCDVKSRLPRELIALDAELTKAIKARLSRGVVD